jgi:catechol 2,3-dioxygenase-like lactoylglutathione lyase family enzyme
VIVQGLDHINISTASLAETRDFFVDVLGMEVGWRPAFEFPGAWLYADGKDLVHLVEVKEKPAPSRGSALDHFAFAIDDYDAVKARLDARGVRYRETAAPNAPIRQFFIVDLNGVTIELNCRS